MFDEIEIDIPCPNCNKKQLTAKKLIFCPFLTHLHGIIKLSQECYTTNSWAFSWYDNFIKSEVVWLRKRHQTRN